MKSADELRAEGRADAVITLTARRVLAPTMTADDWCRLLDVDPTVVRARIAERRAEHAKSERASKHWTAKAPVKTCSVCGWQGKNLGVHRRNVHGISAA